MDAMTCGDGISGPSKWSPIGHHARRRRLQMHILGAIAEFERARIAERVRAGLQRARAQGRRLGRPRRLVPKALLEPVRGLSVRQAAEKLGVSAATAHRWLKGGEAH